MADFGCCLNIQDKMMSDIVQERFHLSTSQWNPLQHVCMLITGQRPIESDDKAHQKSVCCYKVRKSYQTKDILFRKYRMIQGGTHIISGERKYENTEKIDPVCKSDRKLPYIYFYCIVTLLHTCD